MEEQQKQAFRAEIAVFADAIRAYTKGELDRKAYKGVSGGFGSYAQRDDTSMLRLRMACGRLTPQRLAFVADAVERYGISLLKLTTCQTIQAHNLKAQTVIDLMTHALDHDIVTRGGGGDFPRNVMASPLSGVEQGECFDVMPAAQAVADYLLVNLKSVRLPRKLKVGFSNSPANVTHASFRDLGFAAQPDGTFTVFCAGGLGPAAKLGVEVASKVRPQDVLYYVRAMMDTFAAHGNFENRARSRTRFLQDTLGKEGLVAAFAQALTAAKQAGGLALAFQPQTMQKQEDGTIEHPRAIAQKQVGLYTVAYHPIGAMLPVDMPRTMYELTRAMPYVEWRIAPQGTLYCINLTAKEARLVLEITGGGAQSLFERSVACVGASICQHGLQDSQATLAAAVAAVRAAGIPSGALPRIAISGCPSSCGTHQSFALGFQGAAKKVDGIQQPAYTVFCGGQASAGDERLAQPAGVVLETQLPSLLVALGKAAMAAGGNYKIWAQAQPEEVSAILAHYTA